MTTKILLGRRIKQIRKRQGLTQEMLAEQAGISAQYVSNIERGKENPTLDLLLRLADALKIPLGELCDFQADEVNRKKIMGAIREMLERADPDRLRVALKVLTAVLREL